MNPNVTHCVNGHAFTPDNTRIRPSDNCRECRACNRIRAKKNRERDRAAGTACYHKPVKEPTRDQQMMAVFAHSGLFSLVQIAKVYGVSDKSVARYKRSITFDEPRSGDRP